MSLRDDVSVVLHQVRSPDNVGAVARVMANFGFGRLVLSEPATYAFSAAEKLAIKGEHVLEHMRVEKDLPSAIGDCVWAIGTTSRQVEDRRALNPLEAAEELRAQRQRGPVALVFGGEKRGLSDEELSHCQAVLRIATHDEQPSMNLSHAVAVVLFCCAGTAPVSLEQPVQPEGARLERVAELERKMQSVLLASGFANPQAPRHAVRELIDSLLRGQLHEREAQMWLAAFKSLERALTHRRE